MPAKRKIRDLTGEIIYLPSFEQARDLRSRFPSSRIVGYQRGYAVQLRKSGPYVTYDMVGLA